MQEMQSVETLNPRKLLEFGLTLHKEGRASGDENMLLAGGTACTMALNIQSEKIFNDNERNYYVFIDDMSFVLLWWILGVGASLLSGRWLYSMVIFLIIAIGFMFEIKWLRKSELKKSVLLAKQELSLMKGLWSDEEDLAAEFWDRMHR